MAKQIILLETNPQDGGMVTMRAVFWYAIPANRRIVLPDTTVSAWLGASNAELIAIRDGSVLEEVRVLSMPVSSTTAELKAAINKAYTDRLAYLGAQPFKLQYAGVFFDSVTGWSA
jgi:hypothetical protein